MAQTKITLTITPDEYRIVHQAIDCYAWSLHDEAEKVAGKEKLDLRQRRVNVLALRETL